MMSIDSIYSRRRWYFLVSRLTSILTSKTPLLLLDSLASAASSGLHKKDSVTLQGVADFLPLLEPPAVGESVESPA